MWWVLLPGAPGCLGLGVHFKLCNGHCVPRTKSGGQWSGINAVSCTQPKCGTG